MTTRRPRLEPRFTLIGTLTAIRALAVIGALPLMGAACTGSGPVTTGGGASDLAGTDAVNPGGDAAMPVTLGTVTPKGSCALTTLLANTTCEQVTVECAGLEDATLGLIIGEPTGGAPLKGTILFGSGSAGASPMEQSASGKNGETHFINELEALRAEGYRVIERAWQGQAQGDRGWIRGAEGPDASACRYATAMTWLHGRFDADGKVCAVGFSGGSMELAMVMERWQRASLLDYALFLSGPLTRFDHGCNGGAEWQPACDAVKAAHPWQCGAASGEADLSCVLGENITLLLDSAYSNAPICSSRDAANTTRLAGDSPLSPPVTDASYPTTKLGMLLGMRDCGSGAATTGADYATHVTGANGRLSAHVANIADAGHTVHSTLQGAQKMGELLRAGCQ